MRHASRKVKLEFLEKLVLEGFESSTGMDVSEQLEALEMPNLLEFRCTSLLLTNLRDV